jgi:hypothetical protein
MFVLRSQVLMPHLSLGVAGWPNECKATEVIE